jgi:hypothetical protein
MVGSLPLILNLIFLDGLVGCWVPVNGGGLIAVIVPFRIVLPNFIFFPVFFILIRTFVGAGVFVSFIV